MLLQDPRTPPAKGKARQITPIKTVGFFTPYQVS